MSNLSLFQKDKHPPALLVYGGLILIQILFGMNYAVSKVLVAQVPPLLWASVRIIIAAIVMFLASILLNRPHPKDGIKFFVPMIGFALLGAIINQTCFLVGISHTTAINSAVLNSLIPVFTILIVTLRGQEKMTRMRALGFVFALVGVLVLRKIEEFQLSNQTAFGDFLTVINCMSFALFLSYSKKFAETHDRIWMTTWLFIYGAIGISAVAWPIYGDFVWPPIQGPLLAAMVYSVVGATIITYFLNVWVLAFVPSSVASIFVYLQPVVAATVSWFWFQEAPTARTLSASGLIFVGMLLSVKWKK